MVSTGARRFEAPRPQPPPASPPATRHRQPHRAPDPASPHQGSRTGRGLPAEQASHRPLHLCVLLPSLPEWRAPISPAHRLREPTVRHLFFRPHRLCRSSTTGTSANAGLFRSKDMSQRHSTVACLASWGINSGGTVKGCACDGVASMCPSDVDRGSDHHEKERIVHVHAERREHGTFL